VRASAFRDILSHYLHFLTSDGPKAWVSILFAVSVREQSRLVIDGMPDRLTHLRRFYSILQSLEEAVADKRVLSECNGRMAWPIRGVYFFFEPGEARTESGSGTRVVRVGTHALTKKSQTSLWQRLSQHRGTQSTEGGNHRGSIFRLLVGTVLMSRHPEVRCDTWGQGNTASSAVRRDEHHLEVLVSQHIGAMPFLWVAADDSAGPESVRGYLERNAIALLSNSNNPPMDAPSPGWLGHLCPRDRVRRSGLWNSNHVDENYDPAFLTVFERHVATMQCL